ncbi:hypothetical protein EV368DRAFT_80352 [Lentinula lateritia]|nr:hypothetical protein EV368DRAFT_80352 [Lentinula lateritia]
MLQPMSKPLQKAGMEAQHFMPGLAALSFAMQQQAQTQPPFYDPNLAQQQPDYISSQQQQPTYSQPNPNLLADQFSEMRLGGQRSFSFQTANLLTSPPDSHELSLPPPEIQLPHNATVTPSQFTNTDPSYQRSTLNWVPNTSSLLSKLKLPLALVISPYCTVSENMPQVPLVTDTVIASHYCCRTYINPFMYCIDGGNQCHTAVKFGMLATATCTILKNLDHIPDEDNQNNVAIFCFNVSVYFFSLSPGQSEPIMLVISDVDEGSSCRNPLALFSILHKHTLEVDLKYYTPLFMAMNAAGEHWIQVVTSAYPVTFNLSEVFASVQGQITFAVLLADKAVEQTLSHKLKDAHNAVFNKFMEFLQMYKRNMTAVNVGAGAQLAIGENTKMLSVLI